MKGAALCRYDRDLWSECVTDTPLAGRNDATQAGSILQTDLQGLRNRMAALLDMEAAAVT